MELQFISAGEAYLEILADKSNWVFIGFNFILKSARFDQRSELVPKIEWTLRNTMKLQQNSVNYELD